MKLKNIIAFVALVTTFSACDDLFKPAVENAQTADVVFQNPSSAQGILGYAYANLPFETKSTTDIATDDAVTNAAAPNLTCENVTVIYGNWANYTYCEFAGTGYPYVRVQAGVSVDAYSNVRYGHPTDANGNTVVDDNHVHNEGEDHHILCQFDQLYGGGQGVYGTATHDGVTVIYNNK
jgi:hypothetical protein